MGGFGYTCPGSPLLRGFENHKSNRVKLLKNSRWDNGIESFSYVASLLKQGYV